jgi:KDO2-lipid IV(A) lauroyltransferase
MAETLRVITKYKQQGQPVIIGYIADQVPFWNNIHYWTDFLNHDTPVLTGTEKILRRLDHAIFYVDGYRPRRGYYEWEFKLITYEPTKMKEFEITEQYCRMLEKSIQRQPEFWLWSHNRWKRGREEWLRDYVDQETGRVRA